MSKLLILAMALLMVACEDDDNLFTPPDDVADDIFDHINHYRMLNGSPALQYHDTLNHLAAEHAQYMKSQNELSHTNQGQRYETVLSQLNMDRYAELVVSGDLNGKDLIDQWSDNPQSNETILGDYAYIGIGIADNGDIQFATIIFSK